MGSEVFSHIDMTYDIHINRYTSLTSRSVTNRMTEKCAI